MSDLYMVIQAFLKIPFWTSIQVPSEWLKDKNHLKFIIKYVLLDQSVTANQMMPKLEEKACKKLTLTLLLQHVLAKLIIIQLHALTPAVVTIYSLSTTLITRMSHSRPHSKLVMWVLAQQVWSSANNTQILRLSIPMSTMCSNLAHLMDKASLKL